MKYYCKNEVFVNGIRRGGIHATLNWLMPQFNGKTMHIPDLETNYQTIYKPIFYSRNKFINKYYNIKLNNNQNLTFDEIKKIKNIFYDTQDRADLKNFIDKYINSDSRKNFIKKCNADDIGKNKYFIFVLRNPYNLFASRVKLFRNTAKHHNTLHKDTVKIWESLAKEYLGITNLLKSLPGKSLIINYDKWFIDKKYRKEISQKLDLKFSDKGLNVVSNAGGGSSFDKTRLNKNAQKMNVLKRWENYINDQEYVDFFNSHPEIVNLTEKIYNFKKPF